LAVFGVPFPLVVGVAAGAGWAVHRWRPRLVTADGHAPGKEGTQPLISDDALHHDRPSGHRALRILGVGLLVWFAPVAAVVVALTGTSSVYTQQGLFSSRTAVIAFGGAYAARVRRATRRGALRLAVRRRHGPRPRPGRDTPGPLIARIPQDHVALVARNRGVSWANAAWPGDMACH
jgi:hypothetical protein